MPGLNEVAHDSGACSVRCKHCGRVTKTREIIKLLFESIIERVIAGERVTVPGFGAFYLGKIKGRRLVSPILNKPMKFGDRCQLRFSASPAAKQKLNPKQEGK